MSLTPEQIEKVRGEAMAAYYKWLTSPDSTGAEFVDGYLARARQEHAERQALHRDARIKELETRCLRRAKVITEQRTRIATLEARIKEMECPQCKGRGFTDEGDPEIGSAIMDCDRCNSTGRLAQTSTAASEPVGYLWRGSGHFRKSIDGRANASEWDAVYLAPPAPPTAAQVPDLKRAAWMLDCYVEAIKNINSISLEQHPYLPEIEDMAKALHAAAPQPAQGDCPPCSTCDTTGISGTPDE